MRKAPFESFTLGHLLVVITILYGIIIYLMDQRYTHMQTALSNADKGFDNRITELTTTVHRLDWYREQGVDFSYARKYNIKPRTSK